ncbi:MAG TPA: DEAD/DEAH box helicase [Desulfobacteraceae bacterium]|nr:DEAD/DEAH box helicase [Deltaproteobacteria bacterium]HDI58855.1 DEAD/DEAH box helicase [Desulfobacteraceae bacterium]
MPLRPHASKRPPRRSVERKNSAPRLKPGADTRLRRIFARIGIPESGPFVADRFQREALARVSEGDCLVTAPTGAGKTWIAEQAIARVLAAGGRAWYASPLKALTNAKYREFSTAFGADKVGILTGDRKENAEAPVTTGTTEILRNQLYDAMDRGVGLGTDFVVLDEAHYLGDPDRGVVWEEVMIYLPPRVPLLLLSATIGNARQIADWLESIRGRPCAVVQAGERPVPLEALFLHPSGTLMPLTGGKDKNGQPRLYRKVFDYATARRPPRLAPGRRLPPFDQIIRILGAYNLLPAIFFLKSRADCDRALSLCAGIETAPEQTERRRRRLAELSAASEHIARHRQRLAAARWGVAAHHGGQLPAWKLVVETLMTEGLLTAVFATSTVAAGVNFPARTVAFLNTDRFNGKDFAPLTATEIQQMTGRAGRRGMDRIGFVLALPGPYMDLALAAELLAAPPSVVESQVRIDFSMVLNLLLSHSPRQVEELLSRSLAAFAIGQKTRRLHRRRVDGPAQLLAADFRRHLAFLQEHGFVDETGRLTVDGRWASRLRVDQPLIIAQGLRTGVLAVPDPALLAGMIASFVQEKDVNENAAPLDRHNELMDACLALQHTLRPFARQMIDRGFAVRPLMPQPAATVYAWARGEDWPAVQRHSGMAEGDLVMLILRTADNLRHIRALSEAFPETAVAAGQAVDLLMREPVATDWGI